MNKPMLRAGSFNIRFDRDSSHSEYLKTIDQNKISSILAQKESPWHIRRAKVVDNIIFHRVDLIGIQEALYSQITDLESLLGSDWKWIGVGRVDGKKAGEFVPIFYNKNRLKLLDSKHFWLSETPNVPGSIGWDAPITRVATQATFQDLLSNSTFVWINTHFDHEGAKARLESSKLLLNHARELVKSSSSVVKVFLSGDFNCGENEKPYKLLTGKENNTENQKDLSTIIFTDTRYEVSGLKGGSFGFSNTYTGFSKDASQERIDFIFVDSNSILSRDVEVISHGVVSNLYDDDIYISDHRLVISDLLIH